jgi:predicted transport protein
MSDLKLFRIAGGVAQELTGTSVALEKSLQTIIERNMGVLFGVELLASEYSTGPKHGGRIDPLGIDEDGSPVIFEYKRSTNESVINQGLFYLDWLLDHQSEFKLLVMERLDAGRAADIDWRNPRLICVANGFTRYDEHAVKQINRSIELVRYRDFNGELLALELITAARVLTPGGGNPAGAGEKVPTDKTVTDYLKASPPGLQDLFAQLESYIEALGDDVTKKTLKFYFAYRRLKNFACVEIHPQSQTLLIYLKVDPATVDIEEGFSRDMRNIGHYGTGDLELRVSTDSQLQGALAPDYLELRTELIQWSGSAETARCQTEKSAKIIPHISHRLRQGAAFGCIWPHSALSGTILSRPFQPSKTGQYNHLWRVLGSNQRRLSRRFYRPPGPFPGRPEFPGLEALTVIFDHDRSRVCPASRHTLIRIPFGNGDQRSRLVLREGGRLHEPADVLSPAEGLSVDNAAFVFAQPPSARSCGPRITTGCTAYR